MITVPAAEFQRHFGPYRRQADKQPADVVSGGPECLVVLSVDEYRRLRRGFREVLLAADLSDADLDLIEKTDMDPRHLHLDSELT